MANAYRIIKRQLRLLQRMVQDACSHTRFARAGRTMPAGNNHLELSQPFTASATLQAKRHNLALAARRIERVTILPGETFSFWHAVGNPNTHEFAASRGLRNGKVEIERGGGLCQISGIMHHLALIAGLQVTERHSHSVDLYTEETRFCPLGSDATVSYGYRDLRFVNNTDGTLWFTFDVGEDTFRATLHTSAGALPCRNILFEREKTSDGHLHARAIDADTREVLCSSHYVRLSH